MSESALPANSMGSGENVSTFDPLLTKPKKKLRDILKVSLPKSKVNAA